MHVAVCALVLVAFSWSAGPSAAAVPTIDFASLAPQEKPKPPGHPTGQDKPKPANPHDEKNPGKEGERQEKTKGSDLPEIPALTGDRAKDKKAVTAALEAVKAKQAENQKALEALTQGGKNPNPDAEKVKELRARDQALKAHAEKLHALLDQISKQ